MTRETEDEIHICSICQKNYTGLGNDAQPVNSGRCCDGCKAGVVIPARKNQEMRKHYERLWLDMELMRHECEMDMGILFTKEELELAKAFRELAREIREEQEKKGSYGG